MNEYPKKLESYLATLPTEEQEAREQLYRTTLAQAVAHGLQSPRFWAARQVIAGLTEGQIQNKIQKRIRRVPKLDSQSPIETAPRTGKATPVRQLRDIKS